MLIADNTNEEEEEEQEEEGDEEAIMVEYMDNLKSDMKSSSQRRGCGGNQTQVRFTTDNHDNIILEDHHVKGTKDDGKLLLSRSVDFEPGI